VKILTVSYLVPRVSDTDTNYGPYPMHHIVSIFLTSLLLVALQFHQS